jgi:hypothetical protein
MFDFPDEEIMYLKMKDCDEPLIGEGPDPESSWGLMFDGAANVYGNGIGAVIITPKGAHCNAPIFRIFNYLKF